MSNYFQTQYSKINNINLNDTESIKDWYKINIENISLELKPLGINFENKKVLELGCGIGGLIKYLSEIENADVKGIDIDKEQILVCKKFVSENVEERDALEFVSNTEEKFDIVIMMDFIEHIRKNKIVELLSKINNILTENGMIIIRTPNMASFTAPYSRYIDFTHEIGFTSESLNYVLSNAKFKNILFFNAATGYKRIFLIKLLTKIIYSLLRFRLPEIYTSNIIVVAKK